MNRFRESARGLYVNWLPIASGCKCQVPPLSSRGRARGVTALSAEKQLHLIQAPGFCACSRVGGGAAGDGHGGGGGGPGAS